MMLPYGEFSLLNNSIINTIIQFCFNLLEICISSDCKKLVIIYLERKEIHPNSVNLDTFIL